MCMFYLDYTILFANCHIRAAKMRLDSACIDNAEDKI